MAKHEASAQLAWVVRRIENGTIDPQDVVGVLKGVWLTLTELESVVEYGDRPQAIETGPEDDDPYMFIEEGE